MACEIWPRYWFTFIQYIFFLGCASFIFNFFLVCFATMMLSQQYLELDDCFLVYSESYYDCDLEDYDLSSNNFDSNLPLFVYSDTSEGSESPSPLHSPTPSETQREAIRVVNEISERLTTEASVRLSNSTSTDEVRTNLEEVINLQLSIEGVDTVLELPDESILYLAETIEELDSPVKETATAIVHSDPELKPISDELLRR